MSNIEAVEYPFVPGKYGIPFDRLIKRAQLGDPMGFFTSGSKRRLRYTIESDSLEVKDINGIHIGCHMQSFLHDNSAGFALHTKLNPNDKRFNGLTRHPDMFAGKFVGYSLKYFSRQNSQPQACEGYWHSTSDNFKAFFEEYEKTRDVVVAAKATWSGNTFMNYGYTEIKPDDVSITLDDGDEGYDPDLVLNGQVTGAHIYARFRLPKNS